MFLRSDFIVEKTFVPRGAGYTARSGIEVWDYPVHLLAVRSQTKYSRERRL